MTMDIKAKRIVIVESPYVGDIERNVAYARAAVRDCLLRGEAPLASHLLYTQEGILRDEMPEERQLGIAAGLAAGLRADATVVYTDLGTSSGMRWGIAAAEEARRPVEYRQLPGWSTPKDVSGRIANREILAKVDALTKQMQASEERFAAIEAARVKEDAVRYEAAIKRQAQAHRLGIAAAMMPRLVDDFSEDAAAQKALAYADALIRAAAKEAK